MNKRVARPSYYILFYISIKTQGRKDPDQVASLQIAAANNK